MTCTPDPVTGREYDARLPRATRGGTDVPLS
ncbi:hypothetical protein BLAT2472_10099 [Burkholderia latens]